MNESLRTDEEIEQSIHDLLATDDRVNPANMRVQVVGGRVHLNGVVTSEDEHRWAIELVQSVPGVTGVVDEIAVPGATSRPASTGA